jgi:hypothetical protein
VGAVVGTTVGAVVGTTVGASVALAHELNTMTNIKVILSTDQSHLFLFIFSLLIFECYYPELLMNNDWCMFL